MPTEPRVNDNATAEYVATMLGNTPAESASASTSSSSTSWERRSQSQSQSDGNYWLLDSAEIQRLPLSKVILKLRNCPFPIFGKRLDYRKVWRWRGLWDTWQGGAKGFTHAPEPPLESRDTIPLANPNNVTQSANSTV